MRVIVFRSRLRDDVGGDRFAAVGGRMAELASAMPGFVSYEDLAAEDGELPTLVAFATEECLLAWRRPPEHAEAQRRGRDEFLAGYRIQVCTAQRDHRCSPATGRRPPLG